MEPKDRIIVALDVSSRTEALDIVSKVGDLVGMFKIGLQLFTATGPTFVQEIVGMGKKVFLDLKFDDIPNTVAAAAREASKLGVTMFNVHASAGIDSLFAAVDNKGDSKVLAVTVLTSFEENRGHLNFGAPTKAKVLYFAQLAKLAGCDGIVCSPQELKLLASGRELLGLLRVTPGIRDADSPPDDQKRTMTAAEALLAGADYEVIGRPITNAYEPDQAAIKFAQQIAAAKK